MEKIETKLPKDIGIKCYCGSTTKFHYNKRIFKCDKTKEWMFFYNSHPCIKFRAQI